MDLDNGNRFCITKNISLLIKDFSRGWCFLIFYFSNFYAKPLLLMSLIDMKNPKITMFSWFYHQFSLIRSSCVTIPYAKFVFLHQTLTLYYLDICNKYLDSTFQCWSEYIWQSWNNNSEVWVGQYRSKLSSMLQ